MVYMFLADGFEEVEALCPLDILRRAGVEVTTVGVGGRDMIRGAHGIVVQADIVDVMYRDSNPEMIILPGGMPGASNLDESKTVDAALRAGALSLSAPLADFFWYFSCSATRKVHTASSTKENPRFCNRGQKL